MTPPHKSLILTTTPRGPGWPREPTGPGEPWRKDIRVIIVRVHPYGPDTSPRQASSSLQRRPQTPDADFNLQVPRESPPFSPDTTPIILDPGFPNPHTHSLQTSPTSAFPPPSEHNLPTRGRTHTHRFSLEASRALHSWQTLIPFLTSLPRGANETN